MGEKRFAGEPEDSRADIYSLGCVAFWLSTGRLVFEAETPMAMIAAHRTEPPPRPSTCSEPDIPPALDDLVVSCLQKDPDPLPQTADELVAALEQCEHDLPWSTERARRWWERHKPATPGA